MAIYKTERRKKNFSFSGGKFKLGKEDEKVEYGPQPNPSALDKAGLTKKDPEMDALKQKAYDEESGQKKPEMNEETGEIKMNGANQKEANPLDPKALDPKADPKGVQNFLKEKGYKIGVDGKFGPASKKVLNKYYRDEGIAPPNASALDEALKGIGVEHKSYVGKGDGNYHIDGKPVKYTTGEASSGGEIDEGLVTFATNVLGPLQEAVPGVRVTGGNDAYHLSDEYYARRTKRHRTRKSDPKFKNMSTREAAAWGRKNLKASKHTDGKSMDFTVKDPKAARENFLAQGMEKKGNWYIGDGYKILDEYATKTGGGSAPHFHVEVFDPKTGKYKTSDGHKH